MKPSIRISLGVITIVRTTEGFYLVTKKNAGGEVDSLGSFDTLKASVETCLATSAPCSRTQADLLGLKHVCVAMEWNQADVTDLLDGP